MQLLHSRDQETSFTASSDLVPVKVASYPYPLSPIPCFPMVWIRKLPIQKRSRGSAVRLERLMGDRLCRRGDELVYCV